MSASGEDRDIADALPPLMPGGESTSAQLANARAALEQEQAKSGRYVAAYRHVCTMLAAAVQQRDQARAELGRLRAALAEQSTTDHESTTTKEKQCPTT